MNGIASISIAFVAFLTTCKVAGKMSFKNQCIYWHNYFRTLHQVPNVTWSKSLQKEAEDWVKYLAENNKFEHSNKNPGNLYLSHPNEYPEEYCTDAIQWFHWEEKYYNYDRPGYNQAAGHFTTVVWRNSKEIGAAWAIRKDKRLVVSIKYNPGGNYVGYFDNNVFPPIARTLGSQWPYTPPKFTWCPVPVRPTTDSTDPNVVPAAGKAMICSLYLVIASLIFADLML